SRIQRPLLPQSLPRGCAGEAPGKPPIRFGYGRVVRVPSAPITARAPGFLGGAPAAKGRSAVASRPPPAPPDAAGHPLEGAAVGPLSRFTRQTEFRTIGHGRCSTLRRSSAWKAIGGSSPNLTATTSRTV